MLLALALIIIILIIKHKSRIREHTLDQQLERYKSVREAESRQKEKIAKSIHDFVLASLGVIKSSIDKNIKDFGSQKFEIKRLESDLVSLERAISDLREVSHDLMPSIVKSEGLVLALKDFMDKIKDLGNSAAAFEYPKKIDINVYFTLQAQYEIYQICLEILNNLLKHASYKFLKVILEVQDDKLAIDFIHDGVGLTDEQINSHIELGNGAGLKSILGRVAILQGMIKYGLEDQLGKVELIVPFVK